MKKNKKYAVGTSTWAVFARETPEKLEEALNAWKEDLEESDTVIVDIEDQSLVTDTWHKEYVVLIRYRFLMK